MAKCGYCGTGILLGGVSDGGQRFCNNKCRQNGQILSVAQQISPEALERQLDEIFSGNCPKCGGSGPVDIHKAYEVWSALVITRWTTSQKLCCRSCGLKRQIGSAVLSAVLGWWGFPWGLVLTPVQVGRNIIAICTPPDASRPSPALRRFVLVKLGTTILQNRSQPRPSVPPPLPAIRPGLQS
jgi:hypothetical protein